MRERPAATIKTPPFVIPPQSNKATVNERQRKDEKGSATFQRLTCLSWLILQNSTGTILKGNNAHQTGAESKAGTNSTLKGKNSIWIGDSNTKRIDTE
jgi:hypothetical protein